MNTSRHNLTLRIAALLLALLSPKAFGRDNLEKEIVKIHTAKQWKMNDSICFHRENEMVACGRVVGMASYLVAIRVPSLADKVSRGDRLFVAATGPGRQPSSYGDSYVVTRSTSYFVRNITAGTYGGVGFWFPSLHLQMALVPGLTLGIMPSYNRPAAGTNVLGTFATLEWYLGGNSYSGFSWMNAAGIYSTSGTGTASASWETAIHSTLGYRFIARSGFNFGVGAGLQYTKSDSRGLRGNPDLNLLGWRALQVLGRIDLGIAF